VTKLSLVVAAWLDWHAERVLEGAWRVRWQPGSDWVEFPERAPVTDRERGYAQALADVAEYLREGLLSPGGALYETGRKELGQEVER
jgi:hypothetical protein